MKRQFIYIKDAMIILGKGDKYCRALFKKIREKNSKGPKEEVTCMEFCIFCNLNYDKFMEDFF